MRTPVLVLAAVALALACRTSKEAAGPAVARLEPVTGRVAAVDPAGDTITLRVGDREEVVQVAPGAEVRIDDFKAVFDDLEEGQRVRASFDASGAVAQAVKIEILDQATGSAADDGAPGPATPPPADAPAPPSP